jgi:hypothetical protein
MQSMLDGNTEALNAWELKQEQIERNWESQRNEREDEIKTKTEEMVSNLSEQLIWDALETIDLFTLINIIKDKKDLTLGEKIRETIETHIEEQARRIVEQT